MEDLEKLEAAGQALKKEPNTLAKPKAINSWLAFIETGSLGLSKDFPIETVSKNPIMARVKAMGKISEI